MIGHNPDHTYPQQPVREPKRLPSGQFREAPWCRMHPSYTGRNPVEVNCGACLKIWNEELAKRVRVK